MSDEELQLLITLDDPWDPRAEDTFNHLQANNIEYWLGQRFAAWCRLGQRGEAASDNDAHNVTFGQGDWTCTVSRLSGTTNFSMNGNVIESPNKKFDIEVCTITQRKNGEIVEEKQFFDLAGVQKQIGMM